MNQKLSLGRSGTKLKRQLILLSAVGVGVTVSICGAIGFIGLVIPHLGRMLAGPDHRTLLPISALLGALLLTCRHDRASVISTSRITCRNRNSAHRCAIFHLLTVPAKREDSAMNHVVLSGRNISMKYGHRVVLDNISIDIRAGEVTALLE